MKTRNYSRDIRQLAVECVLRGEKQIKVAKMFGIDRATISRWVKKYRQNENFDDLEHKKSNQRKFKLSDVQQLCLIEAVIQPASKFGFETDLWTAPRLQELAKRQFEIEVSDDTIWRMLKRFGFSYKKAEKRYLQADPEVRGEWKKKGASQNTENCQKT